MSEAEPDVLSPELALVCPELAAAARAALPDRPWELFAPPAPPPQPVSSPPPLRLVAPAPPPPRPAPRPARHRPAWRPSAGTAVGLLALVALVVTGLLPARDAPTLGPNRTPPQAQPTSPGAVPSTGSVTPGPYVVREGGTLFVSDDGRAVAGFDPPTRCLPDGATLGAPIAADGSFGVVFPLGEATVELTGRVAGDRVSGTYRVRAPGCDTGRVPFEGTAAAHTGPESGPGG